MSALAWTALWLLVTAASDPAPAPLDGVLAPQGSGRVTVHVAGPPAPVRPGVPFSVAVEVSPRPGIRVYARENRDYAPMTVTFEWPRGVRSEPPVYPDAEPYLFGPLKELVNVYHGPFRITQRATIPPGSAAARAGTLEVTGRLRYQSCDDRVCFPVESLPLRLTISLQAPPGTASGR